MQYSAYSGLYQSVWAGFSFQDLVQNCLFAVVYGLAHLLWYCWLLCLSSKDFCQRCVRTWHPIFHLFFKKTTSISVSCTSYQRRMSGSGRRMLDVVLESSVCVQVCIWTYIQKKSHPWEHSLQAHGGFFQIGAHCRLLVLRWLDTVIRNCNASQQSRAPVSFFFIGFSLPKICRKG